MQFASTTPRGKLQLLEIQLSDGMTPFPLKSDRTSERQQMNSRAIILSLAFPILCGSFQSAAQETGPATLERSREGLAPLGTLERGTRILGAPVFDSQQTQLGSVAELALDLQNGRVVE